MFFSPKFAGSSDPSLFCDLVKTAAATAADVVDHALDDSIPAAANKIEDVLVQEGEGKGGKAYDFVICGGTLVFHLSAVFAS
jgi:hypothetical protein